MNRGIQAAVIVGLAASGWLAAGGRLLGAELMPGEPQQGLLLLANGSVIQGEILLDGEYYRVLLAKGKLQIRRDQVEFFCQTLDEAYARRRARRILTPSNADAHFEMVRWCLQHELATRAREELEAARLLDPSHRILTVMERQIEQFREMTERKHSPVAEVDHTVEPACAIVETPPVVQNQVPAWARTEFVKRIQPMIIHSCASGGCHSPTFVGSLRIDRNALDGVGNPQLIQRNLDSVVSTISFKDLEQSRLLAFGATPHGETRRPSRPLSPHQLEILRAWVTQLEITDASYEESEEQPKTTQIVVGMNSTNQPAPAQQGETTSDPFDPVGFNQEATSPRKGEVNSSESAQLPQAQEGP